MPYLKLKEAAEFLSCSTKTLQRLSADGILTPRIFPRLGKRFHTDDLDALAKRETIKKNPRDFIL